MSAFANSPTFVKRSIPSESLSSLPTGKTLDDIKDLGFYVTLSDGINTVSQKVSCDTVYNSVTGGGITYYVGNGTNVEGSVEYVGGQYIFVLVITGAPASLSANVTTYMTTDVINFGAPQTVTLGNS